MPKSIKCPNCGQQLTIESGESKIQCQCGKAFNIKRSPSKKENNTAAPSSLEPGLADLGTSAGSAANKPFGDLDSLIPSADQLAASKFSSVMDDSPAGLQPIQPQTPVSPQLQSKSRVKESKQAKKKNQSWISAIENWMQKYPRRAMGLALGAVVVVLGGIVFLVVSMGLRTTENGVSGGWEGNVFVLNRDVEEDSIEVHRSEFVPQANPGRNSGKSDSVTTAKTGTVELFCPVAKDETAVRTGFFLPKRVSADYVIGVGNVLHLVEPNLQISVDKNYLGWVRYGKESGNQLNYQIVYKLPDHLLKRRSEWCTWLKEKRAVVSPSEDWMALVDYEERGLVHLLKSNADDEEKQLITKPVATVELSTESIDFLDWVDDETLVSLSGGHVQFWDAGQMARSGSVDLANIGTVSGAYRGPIRLSVNRQFTVVANAHTMDLIDNESRKLHTQIQVEGIVSELTVAENLSYLAYRATETKDSVIVADLATGEQSQFRLSTSKPIELDRDGNRPELVMGIGFWQNRLVVGSRPSVLLDPGTGKVIEAIPGT